tara:strand:+ start:5972 stop:6742 length:771 start_codon:yes stop_codon:yes gene_type:complete
MKGPVFLVIPFLFLLGCNQNEILDTEVEKEFWTLEKENQFLADRNDSAKWDWDMFNQDLEARSVFQTDVPVGVGVFPCPNYDLLGKGSFGGIGMFGTNGDGDELKIGEKSILYNSFYVKASDAARGFVGIKEDRVFFQIIVLTDFIDTLNYSHLQKQLVSRNHPDYIGEGFYKTQNNKIDYVAFITANQSSYAIVNMRMFDLTKGRTILIAPQKDGSLRSMQIDSPVLSSQEIQGYTDKLLKKEEIENFFSQRGNI